MKVKNVIDEWFSDYKKAAMFIASVSCNGKCFSELGLPPSICQNDGWRVRDVVDIPDDVLCRRFINNPITEAIVFGGLEPFEQTEELIDFLEMLRNTYECNADVVIYTGYNPDEIKAELAKLRRFTNIIVKFGRYIPNKPKRYDEVLGVELASDNQYAERIS